MYIDYIREATIFESLHHIDCDLAESVKRRGCPRCQGPLHHAFYYRKPRGGPDTLPEQFSVRMSLCCGTDGCRRRLLPPSCLFIGPKVYWSAIILVVVALRQRRPNSFSAAKLRALFDVSWETVRRWMSWFAETFPKTDLWRRRRGLVPPTVGNDELPAALIEHFERGGGDLGAAVVGCLEFLATGRVSAMEEGRSTSRKRCPEARVCDP